MKKDIRKVDSSTIQKSLDSGTNIPDTKGFKKWVEVVCAWAASRFKVSLFNKVDATEFQEYGYQTGIEDQTVKEFAKETLKGAFDNYAFNVSPIGEGIRKVKENKDKKEISIQEQSAFTSVGLDSVHGEPERTIDAEYRDRAVVSSFIFADTSPIGKSYVKNLGSE